MVANIFGPDLGIVLVIIILVVLFGSQLPKIARNVGTAGREFRKAQEEAEEEAEKSRAAKAAAASGSAASGVAPASVPFAPPAVGPAPASPVLSTPAAGEERLTLSRSELDALLKAREEQARREPGPTN